MTRNECLPRYPDDGLCHGDDADGVKVIDSLEKVGRKCTSVASRVTR
jgi:hypothetical protein